MGVSAVCRLAPVAPSRRPFAAAPSPRQRTRRWLVPPMLAADAAAVSAAALVGFCAAGHIHVVVQQLPHASCWNMNLFNS